jgi:hypothetical protein
MAFASNYRLVRLARRVRREKVAMRRKEKRVA